MHSKARRTRQYQDLHSSLMMAQIQADELEELRLAALIAMSLDAVADRLEQIAREQSHGG